MLPSISYIKNRIPPPLMNKRLVVRYQTVPDILKLTQLCIKNSESYINNFSNIFAYPHYDIEDTCRDIYDFLREKITYDKEPPESQTAKNINRFIYDGYGDCKHFSAFAYSVLKSLGIKCNLRLCGYRENSFPSHIYVMAYNTDGSTICLDGTLNNFNRESKSLYICDVINGKIPNMLYQLSGESCQPNEEIGRWRIGKFLKRITNTAGLKRTIHQVEQVVKTVVHTVAMVGLAPAREAFLLAVDINLLGLASHFAKVWGQGHKNEIINFWQKFAGNPNALLSAIKKGSHQNLSGKMNVQNELKRFSKYYLYEHSAGQENVGVLPIAAAGAAAPIIVAVLGFFKAMASKTGDNSTSTKNTLSTLEQGANAMAQTLNNGENTTTMNLPDGNKAGFVKETSNIWKEYKLPIILVGGGLVAFGAYKALK